METLHYFIDSWGPRPTSYYKSNFGGLETVPLVGFPAPAREELLGAVLDRARELGTESQVIHCPVDGSLLGAVFPQKGTGVYGFSLLDPRAPDYLGALGGPDLAAAEEHLSAARKTLARARVFHDGQEKIYGQHMDFAAAGQAAESLVWKLVKERPGAVPGREVHRFFGAATVQGAVDFIPQVTGDIPRRVFLKGRPGTGKSTLLKRVAQAARQAGQDVELYHCSLDPGSLDLVAVRGAGFCVLDSTAPHEYFPERPGDEVVDLYEKCVAPGTDEACWEDLEKLRSAYRALVQTATGFLREAQAALERYYAGLPQPSPQALERVKEGLCRELLGVN